MPPFLILQLRPEPEASDSEYAAILQKAGLAPAQAHRIRLDAEPLPDALDDLTTYSGVIVGGGPGCVPDAPADKAPVEAKIEAAVLSLMPEVIEKDIPFLGCCYGIGILGQHLACAVSFQFEGWVLPHHRAIGGLKPALRPALQTAIVNWDLMAPQRVEKSLSPSGKVQMQCKWSGKITIASVSNRRRRAAKAYTCRNISILSVKVARPLSAKLMVKK